MDCTSSLHPLNLAPMQEKSLGNVDVVVVSLSDFAARYTELNFWVGDAEVVISSRRQHVLQFRLWALHAITSLHFVAVGGQAW
jgi:hypothetical protein